VAEVVVVSEWVAAAVVVPNPKKAIGIVLGLLFDL
jgi:hypothetical protein